MGVRHVGVRYFVSERGSASSAVLRYVAALTITIGSTLWSGSIFWDAVLALPNSGPNTGPNTGPELTSGPAGAAQTASAVLESGDDWTQSLRSEKFWASKKSGEPVTSYKTAKSDPRASAGPDFNQRSGLLRTSVPTPSSEAKSSSSSKSLSRNERADGSNWYSGDGNHRTVCVRLCDGYFWPISFSTDSDSFERDKRVCESSCGGTQTRLFVHDNPGQDVEQMVDLKGVAYTKLRTAFLFRSNYDESCKCNAHPWEQASKDRHRVYALEAEKRKGSQHAAAELTRMKSALIDARKAAATVRVAAVDTARSGAAPSSPAQRGSKRGGEAPVAGMVARHSPLSGLLVGDEGLTPLAAEAAYGASVSTVPPQSQSTSIPDISAGRLQQWAQLMPQALPKTVSKSDARIPAQPTQQPSLMPSGAQPLVVATSEVLMTLPTAPFALPTTAPAVPPVATQTAALAASLANAAVTKPSAPKIAAPAHNLAVAAPPIIAGANVELGLKAPLAVNTAQLEQVNVARKPSDQPKAADQVLGASSAPKQKVAAVEPLAVPRAEPKRREASVVEREPERPAPREERRAIVVRPTTPARVVERPAPKPAVRVVEAPRAAPPVARVRPQQVTVVRNDNWRVRVFESR